MRAGSWLVLVSAPLGTLLVLDRGAVVSQAKCGRVACLAADVESRPGGAVDGVGRPRRPHLRRWCTVVDCCLRVHQVVGRQVATAATTGVPLPFAPAGVAFSYQGARVVAVNVSEAAVVDLATGSVLARTVEGAGTAVCAVPAMNLVVVAAAPPQDGRRLAVFPTDVEGGRLGWLADGAAVSGTEVVGDGEALFEWHPARGRLRVFRSQGGGGPR